MSSIATFLDTTLHNYVEQSKALTSQGWKAVRNTQSNRRTILLKYYEYLVNTNAKIAGINPAMLTPQQLQPVWEKANTEYGKYEMYVKSQAVVSNNNAMGGDGAPAMMAEEVFASANDVERMQPGYIDIDDLLAGFSKMSFGGKRSIRKRSTRKHKIKKHTKRRHAKSLKKRMSRRN